MSTNGTALEPMIRPAAMPGRVGQATAVEQSRAVAEVQAAVIVAQQCPRSVQLAIEAMEEACRQIELAEVAFFRFPRAEGVVEGPSVHLARELARCWGNIQYGVRELARDDAHRQSEMQAWAWDVQTNTRDSSDFIVPHQRDTKKGVKDLVDLRDIYENNANNGARRLREMIFAMLPVWYRARAEKLCRQTIESGGGLPLAQRIADAVRAFERHRVSPARLAARFGYERVDQLTAVDVAQLGVIYSSIQQGTIAVGDEFPDEAARIKPDDLAPAAAPKTETLTGAADAAASASTAAPAGAQVAPPAEPPLPPSEMIRVGTEHAAAPETASRGHRARATPGQVGRVNALIEPLGYAGDDQREARLRVLARLADRNGPLGSSKDLTGVEAALVIRRLNTVKTPGDLDGILADLALADDPRDEEATDGE